MILKTIRKTSYRLDRTPIPLCRSLFIQDELSQEEADGDCLVYEKRKDAIAYSKVDDGVEQIEDGTRVSFHRIGFEYKSEDILIFNFLQEVLKKQRTKTISQSGRLNIPSLNYAFTIMQSNRFKVDKILLNPCQYVDLVELGKVNKGPSFGDMWGAKILVSENFPEYYICLLPPSEDLGILSICDNKIVGINVLDVNSMASIEMSSMR